MDFITYFYHILELVIKGMIIGIIASAPMGPVGILCIRRTMRKGRVYGLVTGLGAALSDIFYAIITGIGMSFMMRIIDNDQYNFWLKLLGGIMLFLFGVWTLRSDPKKIARPNRNKKGNGTYFQNFVTGFLLTLSNPLIILLFIAVFNIFSFVIPNNIIGMSAGYISIVIGAMIWWYGLTLVIAKAQNNFGLRGIVRLNQSIAWFVIIFSLICCLMAVFHLNLY